MFFMVSKIIFNVGKVKLHEFVTSLLYFYKFSQYFLNHYVLTEFTRNSGLSLLEVLILRAESPFVLNSAN